MALKRSDRFVGARGMSRNYLNVYNDSKVAQDSILDRWIFFFFFFESTDQFDLYPSDLCLITVFFFGIRTVLQPRFLTFFEMLK